VVASDRNQIAEISEKLDQLKQSLLELDVLQEIQLNSNLHNREIRLQCFLFPDQGAPNRPFGLGNQQFVDMFFADEFEVLGRRDLDLLAEAWTGVPSTITAPRSIRPGRSRRE
jgi:hypothetical protein